MNLPDFFVVGAPKTGTTSLFYYLSKTQAFYKPEIKEPSYLAYDQNKYITSSKVKKKQETSFITDFEDYKAIYANCPEDKITGDFSTHYLYHGKTFIEKVRQIYGKKFQDVPIIIVLRDPVERAFSHYMMKRRDNLEHLSFKEAIQPQKIKERLGEGFLPSFDYIGFSKYKKQVTLMQDAFKNVLVLDFKSLKNDRKAIFNKIKTFLSINNMDIEVNDNVVYNKSGIPKESAMAKMLYWFQYRENFIKRCVPDSIRHKFGRRFGKKIKALFSNYTLKSIDINRDEYDLAKKFLNEDIIFYKNINDYK